MSKEFYVVDGCHRLADIKRKMIHGMFLDFMGSFSRLILERKGYEHLLPKYREMKEYDGYTVEAFVEYIDKKWNAYLYSIVNGTYEYANLTDIVLSAWEECRNGNH